MDDDDDEPELDEFTPETARVGLDSSDGLDDDEDVSWLVADPNPVAPEIPEKPEPSEVKVVGAVAGVVGDEIDVAGSVPDDELPKLWNVWLVTGASGLDDGAEEPLASAAADPAVGNENLSDPTPGRLEPLGCVGCCELLPPCACAGLEGAVVLLGEDGPGMTPEPADEAPPPAESPATDDASPPDVEPAPGLGEIAAGGVELVEAVAVSATGAGSDDTAITGKFAPSEPPIVCGLT